MHTPVMLNEVIKNLNIKPNGIYLDVTFGCGGHTKEILKHLGNDGKIYVFDKDYSSISIAKELSLIDNRIFYFHSSFRNIYNILKNINILGKVNGIVADLGISSLQLSDFSRGFSFLNDGFLDMRMDFKQELNAFNWINTSRLNEINDVLFNYGNEIFSKRIARNIINYRKKKVICTTHELSNIVSKSYPINYISNKHYATKTFQAIRIFINKELEELDKFLKDSINMLNLNGRLVVISFHSLEDRIVKQFMYSFKNNYYNKNILYKPLFNYLKPSPSEIKSNYCSRSAIMRCLERIC